MTITEHDVRNVIVLEVSGRRPGTPLGSHVLALVNGSQGTRIVINFTEGHICTQPELTLLARANELAAEAGGGVRLANANSYSRMYLQIAGLAEIFRDYSTVEEAITSFSPP